MAYGFRVTNSDGKVVVDSERPSLVAVGKGSITMPRRFTSSTSIGTINATGTSRGSFKSNVYGGKMASPAIGELLFLEAPANQRVYLRLGNNEAHIWATVATIRWVTGRFMRWVTPPSKSTPEGQYGLEVRDAQGQLTYHSGVPLMALLGTLDSPGGGNWFCVDGQMFFSNQRLAYVQGAHNTASGLVPQGMRPGNFYNAFDGGSSGYTGQKIRGIVTDINYDSL